MDRICDILKFILKYLCFKKAWNSQFCWHHQNRNLTEVTFKESSKVEKFRNNVLKCHLYLHFLIQQKLLISVKKCWSQQNSRGVSHKFWVFFRKGITVQSSIVVVHDFTEVWAFLALNLPHQWANCQVCESEICGSYVKR